MSNAHAPLLCKGDLDGFFGLMVDNLVQVLLIIVLCKSACGFTDHMLLVQVLPGVAVSLLLGNLYYAWAARRVARRDDNAACTALPYGINTVTVFAFVLFVMAPVYRQTRDPQLAWRVGLLACLVSGLTELLGAFVAERLRRITPRVALLGVLSGIAITFIASDFAFRLYHRPLVGLAPFAIILLVYFARYRFPLGIPGGAVAILLGTAVAWATGQMDPGALAEAVAARRLCLPQWAGGQLGGLLAEPTRYLLPYLPIAIPMGLLSVLGSLQNIESAEAAGDRFDTTPALAVDGLGTIAAALFGSCFPTSIYIGHPGWKALGARSAYSVLNGLFFTALFIFGLGGTVAAAIPIEAGAAIVLWIALLITAQAYQETPKAHAPAAAVAIFPALGAFAVVTLQKYLPAIGVFGGEHGLAEMFSHPALADWLPGAVVLTSANSGWILVALILSAITAALIDRRFGAAALWATAGAVLTLVGFLHTCRLDGNDIREWFVWQIARGAPEGATTYYGWKVAVGYLAAAGLFLIARATHRPDPGPG